MCSSKLPIHTSPTEFKQILLKLLAVEFIPLENDPNTAKFANGYLPLHPNSRDTATAI